jgi:hypothetical protein
MIVDSALGARSRRALLLLPWLTGCVGTIADTPFVSEPLSVQEVESELALEDRGGFADEAGGGVFATPEGLAVRLRSDGTRAPLESHPGNVAAPGKVLRVLPSGPHSALVAADNGVYLAESGWLIEPAWREALEPAGVRAAALSTDGVVWIAHERGLFRREAGELSELKLGEGSLVGISALAVAPAPDGANAIWFAQGERVGYARQTGRTRYEVVEDALEQADLGGPVLAMAGLSATPSEPAELWLLSDAVLIRHSPRGFTRYVLARPASGLVAAGRFLWLSAGDSVFRYDARRSAWGEVKGLSAVRMLAADASGSLWLRANQRSLELSSGSVPRVVGLFEGERVYARDLRVRARLPSAAAPEAVQFALDDAAPVERALTEARPLEGSAQGLLEFALGGFDAAEREQGFSLAGLASGLHTLTITARFAGQETRRELTFELRESAATQLSFVKDVLPIYETRCAKCHAMGPGHALSEYAQWVEERERIVRAVVELRMPADGPLDPAQIQIVQRWAAGGAAP